MAKLNKPLHLNIQTVLTISSYIKSENQERTNYEVPDLELNQQVPANGQINCQLDNLVGQPRRAVIFLQLVPVLTEYD